MKNKYLGFVLDNLMPGISLYRQIHSDINGRKSNAPIQFFYTLGSFLYIYFSLAQFGNFNIQEWPEIKREQNRNKFVYDSLLTEVMNRVDKNGGGLSVSELSNFCNRAGIDPKAVKTEVNKWPLNQEVEYAHFKVPITEDILRRVLESYKE